MPELSDEQFVQAVFDRLRTHGWITGKMGKYEGPNCLIGAAAFVQHNGALKMDLMGIQPLTINGEKLVPEDNQDVYDAVPGITRLARITGLSSSGLFALNDSSKSVEEVEENLRHEMANNT